jgi:hypothetical protein
MKVFFKLLSKVSVAVVLLTALGYLLIPSPPFPKILPDGVQSLEQADTETSLRRSYFTNLSREAILRHYQNEFSKGIIIPIPSYIVYYPPEDAQTLIRDQTRSVNLPEIIHPLRESFCLQLQAYI